MQLKESNLHKRILQALNQDLSQEFYPKNRSRR